MQSIGVSQGSRPRAVEESLGGVSLGGGRSGAGLGACVCACVRAVAVLLVLTVALLVGETLAFFRRFSLAVAVFVRSCAQPLSGAGGRVRIWVRACARVCARLR